jgi:hypothetical protein
VTALVVANVVRHDVARTKSPPEAIINKADLANSATTIAVMLPAQTKLTVRIFFVDIVFSARARRMLIKQYRERLDTNV